MAWYKVLLHGQGIRFVVGDDKPATGFYTTRAVKADSAEEAVMKAKAMVAELWSEQEYKDNNKGSAPTLTTEEVAEISYWRARKIPNKGHIFYEGGE